MYFDVHVHPVPDGIVKEFPRGLFEEYVDMFGVDMYEAISVEKMVEEFEVANISKAVLLPVAPCTVNPSVSYSSTNSNRIVAEIANKYPDKFIGFASVDPHQGDMAISELENCVHQLNLKGLKLLSNLVGLDINDQLLYPIYATAEKLEIPVLMHTGSLLDQQTKIKHCRPLQVDDVAVDFPSLKIIMAHFGWPWVEEAIAVVMRNKNVYFDISGWRPRYLPKALLDWMHLKAVYRKALFGTDYPLVKPQLVINEVQQLPLKDDIKECLLYKNAREFFKI